MRFFPASSEAETPATPPRYLTELMNALTGFDYTEQELSQVGERIWNLERLYNLREGVEEDLPPVRFYQEALDDGQQDGEAISLERFIAARSQVLPGPRLG